MSQEADNNLKEKLKVRYNGEETVFQVRRKAKIRKIFRSFYLNKGLKPASLVFAFNGERLIEDGDKSIADIGISELDEDGDPNNIIDTQNMQHGGYSEEGYFNRLFIE